MSSVLMRDRRGEEINTREGDVKVEAEIGGMWPQANDAKER